MPGAYHRSAGAPDTAGRLPAVSDDRHHETRWVGVAGRGRVATSAAVRGFPGAAPGLEPLLAAVPSLAGRIADVTGSAGGGALAAGPGGRVSVLEPSAAALAAARTTHARRPEVEVAAALPWEMRTEAFDHVLLLPPTDRGSARVRAELAAAASGLAPDGVAYAAMHKDQGGKRYEREAGTLFGDVRVMARERGWRVLRLAEPRPPPAHATPWLRFEARGRAWWALPGVFAAGRLDAGSAALLAALDRLPGDVLAGRTVGDLGCGAGVLAGAALARGAGAVVASDDDLAAVRSSRRNLAGARARVLHSDLDAGWPADARVDAFLMNPPFHLGKDVRLELPFGFLGVARRRLRPGGLLLLVANRALPYERQLAGWAELETLSETGGFKVLRALR